MRYRALIKNSPTAKHHKHHKYTPDAASPEELERKAKEQMETGKWRQARDAYKILCKQDRAKYLPGLIQANRGLAEDLMQKGQISEAEQVLAHLRTIAPESEFAGITLKGAIRDNDWQGAAESAVEIWKNSGGAVNEHDRQSVADALVLSFPQLDGQSETADWPEALRNELSGVLGALRAVSKEQYDRAQELLRPIPRASVFADWKTLIKGLIAFYTGAPEKAQTLFAMLPPQSVTARAAAPCRAITDPKLLTGPRTPERDRTVASLCHLMGAPGVASVLVAADELWKARKERDSLNRMRLAAEFPSRASTLVGALSEFYFRAPFTFGENAFMRYIEAIDRLSETPKNEDERFLACRALVGDSLRDPYGNAEEQVREFLEFFQHDPRLPKLTSIALATAAEKLIYQAELEDESVGFGPDESENAQDAIRLLEESVEADSGNLEASLKLVEQYKRARKKSERNRLLDQMAKRFPNEKRVLLQAGIECIERKAFVKGLDYLERAHQLDPLDSEVAEWIAAGQLRLAQQQYEKKQTEKARATFAAVTSRPAGEKLDFVRNPEFIHAQQAILEMLYGEKEKSEELISQARRETRSTAALLLFLHSCYRLDTKRPKTWKESPFWEEFTKTVPRTPQERMDLLLTLRHLEYLEDEEVDWLKENATVLKHLAPAAEKDFNVKEAGDLALQLQKRKISLDLARRLVSRGVKEDPKNPRLRILDIMTESAPPTHRIEELEEAIRDAKNAGDLEIVNAAQDALDALRFYAGPNPFAHVFDEDEYEDEEDDFDDAGAGFDMPKGFESMFGELEEIRKQVLLLSDKEFAEFRKQTIREMPAEMFDALIGSVRKGKSASKSSPPPKPPPQPQSKPRASRSKDDHPELF